MVPGLVMTRGLMLKHRHCGAGQGVGDARDWLISLYEWGRARISTLAEEGWGGLRNVRGEIESVRMARALAVRARKSALAIVLLRACIRFISGVYSLIF